MITPGTIVGAYEVESRVGEGGAATVYRVRHGRLGSTHALKVLHIGGPSQRRRLLAEGQAQAALSHPNLVSVTDVVESDEHVALVMEYVEGIPLDQELLRRRLGFDEAEALFRGIVSGVAFAHAAGLVHRDLKPSNVLLRRIGDELIPKVTDFGLAKALRADQSHTRTGTFMGTPPYAPPEQIRDAKDVDARGDVWALGCLLYELLSGQRAYPQATIIEVYESICKGTRPPLLQVEPNAPERLARLAEACLSIERDQRPADARALMVELGMTPPRSMERTPTVELGPADAPATFHLGGELDEPVGTHVPARSVAPWSQVSVVPSALESSERLPSRAPAPPRRRWPLAVALLVLLGLATWGGLRWGEDEVPAEVVPRPVATTEAPLPEPSEPQAEPAAPEPSEPVEATASQAPPAEPPPPAEEPVAAEPAPTAPAPAPAGGRFTGPADGTATWLVRGDERYPPGELPPGDYDVYADFPEVGEVHAGRLYVAEGEHLRLRCNDLMLQCGKEGR